MRNKILIFATGCLIFSAILFISSQLVPTIDYHTQDKLVSIAFTLFFTSIGSTFISRSFSI